MNIKHCFEGKADFNYQSTTISDKNIFALIGTNNSGKSRTLREIAKMKILSDKEQSKLENTEKFMNDFFLTINKALDIKNSNLSTEIEYKTEYKLNPIKNISTIEIVNVLQEMHKDFNNDNFNALYKIITDYINTLKNRVEINRVINVNNNKISNQELNSFLTTISENLNSIDYKNLSFDDLIYKINEIKKILSKIHNKQHQYIRHTIFISMIVLYMFISLSLSNNKIIEFKNFIANLNRNNKVSIFENFDKNWNFIEKLTNILDVSSLHNLDTTHIRLPRGPKTVDNILKYIKNEIPAYIPIYLEHKNLLKIQTNIYIPIIRGLRPFDGKNDVYKNRTISDYKLEGVQVATGLSMFNDIKKLLLSNVENREKVNAFERFLQEHVFDGEKVSLTIPEEDNKDVINIKIGTGAERDIYNLGDGVQQFITILFYFFQNKDNRALVCIEEPEMHLHPKWQRKFIDVIKNEFPDFKVFFTTHSNVFINHEAVDVYKVEKEFNESNKEITVISKAIDNDRKELLAELGYQASDVLGHNYTLLVEGPSDKIFIERFISTYSNDKLQIDNHYNVLPFHGKGNLKKHYGIDNEPINLEKLNHNFGIVVDSDLNHTETNTLKNKLNSINKFFWCTHGRSIENTIPRKTWIKALVEDEQVIYYDNNQIIDDLTKVNSFEEERYSKINEKKYSDVKSILNSLNITLTEEQSSILDKKITENNKFKKGFFRSDDSKILQVDKVKIANQVTLNYPVNKEELLQSPELAYYIPKLCKAIYKANGMIEEANAIAEEYLETAKKALEEAIKAEVQKIKQAISGHQPKQSEKVIEGKIDENQSTKN